MKNQFKLGVIYLLAGMFFIVLCFIFPDNGIFYGLAGASIGPGLLMLYKHNYWKKRPSEYEEKIENDKIELTDERKEMIRGKSARLSIMLNWILQSIIIISLAFLKQFEVLPYDYVNPVINGITLCWTISAVSLYLIYIWMSKKY
ncbi:hypothetical protein AN641_09125 [Candidatus Epulonipiscioides gigas]|nr:hypothetical protein AN641_09125 [Epulopiscium sp. SCG-C07WGA-EpuloA2]